MVSSAGAEKREYDSEIKKVAFYNLKNHILTKTKIHTIIIIVIITEAKTDILFRAHIYYIYTVLMNHLHRKEGL